MYNGLSAGNPPKYVFSLDFIVSQYEDTYF